MAHTTGYVIKGCVWMWLRDIIPFPVAGGDLKEKERQDRHTWSSKYSFHRWIFFFFSADLLPKSVESVFIFQEASEGEPNVAPPAYDAIVVEQWTIIDVSTEGFLFVTVSQILCFVI